LIIKKIKIFDIQLYFWDSCFIIYFRSNVFVIARVFFRIYILIILKMFWG